MSLCNRNRSIGGGLLVAVRDDTNMDMIVTDVDTEKEQMWVKIKTQSGDFNMGILYGLHETRSTNEEIEEWFYKLGTSISKWSNEPIVILGDMNAHIGCDDKGIVGNHQDVNKNGKWWREVIDARNLLLINNTNMCTGKWTRNSVDGRNSIIDFVLCNEMMYQNMESMHIDEAGKWAISRFRKIEGAVREIPSDHNPIIVELKVKSKQILHKEKVWRITENGLNSFKKETDIEPMKEQWNRGGDVNQKYKRWFKQIKNLMYQHFTRATKKSKYRSKIIKCKIRKKNKIKTEMKNTNKCGLAGGLLEEKLKEKLGEVLNEIGEEMEKERKENINRRMERIAEKQSTATNEIWKVRSNAIKRPEPKMAVEDSDGNILTSKDDILLRHNEYFKTLLQSRKPEPAAECINREIEENFKLNMQNRKYDSDPVNEEFTMEELEDVIKNLKTGKCPGMDEITNEIIKAAGKELKISLLNMVNWFWNEEQLPEDLTKIHIKSIYKGKGKTSSLSNHRGIFLGSEIIKLYEKLVYARCGPKVDKKLTEFQAGGRPHRNISDHIFILRSIMRHLKYMNISLVTEFLDLIKAFDKMSLKHVLNDLWRCEVRGKVWRTIYQINKQSNISVKTPMGDSPEFKIGEALKQGSVLASSLAAMHTDRLAQMFDNEGLGVLYGELRINCLLFQDDIVKIETSNHKMNKSNKIITQYQQMNLMEFHQDKSKYMSTEKVKATIKLGEIVLKETDSYVYLGDIISTDGTLKETIEARNKSCTSTLAELNSILEETAPENILIEAVITYHNSIIIPKLCLNSETWDLSSTELQALEVIQNKSIKRMLRLPQGTPSQGLRAELGIFSVESVISKRRLRYFHRILNLPDENITRKVMMQQLSLPENTWLDETLSLCRKLKLCDEIDSITNVPKNMWKKLIEQAVEKDETEKLEQWAGQSKKYSSATLTVNKKSYIKYLPPALGVVMLKARTGMINVKVNYKNLYNDDLCRKCGIHTEDLQHILRCRNKLSTEENQLISDTPAILRNIDKADPVRVVALAQMIYKEIKKLQLVEAKEATLESTPALQQGQATSEEEDIK